MSAVLAYGIADQTSKALKKVRKLQIVKKQVQLSTAGNTVPFEQKEQSVADVEKPREQRRKVPGFGAAQA